MEKEGPSVQLLLVQTGIGTAKCVGHIAFSCVFFLFHGVVRSDYDLFILVFVYEIKKNRKMEKQQNIVFCVHPLTLSLKPSTLSA